MRIELQQVQDASTRLEILKVLEECGEFSIYVPQLYDFFIERRRGVAYDNLLANLDWLAAQKLIEMEQRGGCWFAILTPRGRDVQAGRTRVPGVQRPMSGY